MTQLHWTEIDGVPVVWADAPGPLRATLLFRTGRVDETVTAAGWTHLCEHLAFPTIGEDSSWTNAFVTGLTTRFTATGAPEDIVEFFAQVCANLSSLPMDRIDSEKAILSAEASTWDYDPISTMYTWRYGARGWGLAGLGELGLYTATAENLEQFASERFTRGNAIMWLSGPPPSALRLSLPEGERISVPMVQQLPYNLPGWYVDDHARGLLLSTTVPHTVSASVFCELAGRRLRDALRTDSAVSYAPTVCFEPLDSDTAHLVLRADSDYAHRHELSEAFRQAIERFDDIGEDELAMAKDRLEVQLTGSLAPAAHDLAIDQLQQDALNRLFGRKGVSREDRVRKIGQVGLEDLQAFWAQARETAIFALPSQARVGPWCGGGLPLSLTEPVQGPESLSVDAPIDAGRLVHADEGITLKWPGEGHLSARYADLAAAMVYEDGAIGLIAEDGVTAWIEPSLWHGGARIAVEARERVPQDLLIDLGARAASSIPRRRTTAWQRFWGRDTQSSSRAFGLAVLVVAALGILMCVITVAPAVALMIATSGSMSGVFVFVLCMLLGGAAVGCYIGVRLVQARPIWGGPIADTIVATLSLVVLFGLLGAAALDRTSAGAVESLPSEAPVSTVAEAPPGTIKTGSQITSDWRERTARDYPGWTIVSVETLSDEGLQGETYFVVGLVPPGESVVLPLVYSAGADGQRTSHDDFFRLGAKYASISGPLLEYLKSEYYAKSQLPYYFDSWDESIGVALRWRDRSQDVLEYDARSKTWSGAYYTDP